MDGTDYTMLRIQQKILAELQSINKRLSVLTDPTIVVTPTGTKVVHNDRCDCDKCTRPIEPKIPES